MCEEREPFHPSPRPRRHSGFGIASVAIALLSGLLILGCCGLAMTQIQTYAHYGYTNAAHAPEESKYVSRVAVTLCGFAFFSSLLGVVFGIVGVAQRNVKKDFGILGLILNGLILLLYAGFVLLILL